MSKRRSERRPLVALLGLTLAACSAVSGWAVLYYGVNELPGRCRAFCGVGAMVKHLFGPLAYQWGVAMIFFLLAVLLVNLAIRQGIHVIGQRRALHAAGLGGRDLVGITLGEGHMKASQFCDFRVVVGTWG